MQNVRLELDCVGGENLLGTADTGFGTVIVKMVNSNGPGGGTPIVSVEGPAPSVLAWLLEEYHPDYVEALEFMRLHGEVGRTYVGAAELI